jgi:glycosyltransferase involved in cell wall biosynthesis
MSNILMVAPQPFFRARGTPFSILHRIRALLSSGRHRIHLLTYPFGEDVRMPGLTITRCKRPLLVRDVSIGPSLAKALLDVRLYALTARTLRNASYDVIHSHEEAAFFCQRFADQYRIPHIYDMHSSLPQQLSNFSRFDVWPLRRLFRYLEAGVLERCDGIITICAELGEIADPYATDKPHSMIENTADDSTVFGTGDGSCAGLPGLDGKRVILYTGTLEKYQGLDLLLGAFGRVRQAIPQAHLLLVGGTESQVKGLQSQLEQQGLVESVTLTGTVHPSRIPDIYRLAQVIVSPRSRGTNTPLKIYSYLRSGKPIVATNLLTHTQTLTEDMACLVEPSIEGLASGITRVLLDESFASHLSRAAMRKAATSYPDSAYISKVNEFFSRVMHDEGVASNGCSRGITA